MSWQVDTQIYPDIRDLAPNTELNEQAKQNEMADPSFAPIIGAGTLPAEDISQQDHVINVIEGYKYI
jgi:hypothetical protein